jgi:hypothetical protein
MGQADNRRHHKVGHLFQGRVKAILVDRDAYLLDGGLGARCIWATRASSSACRHWPNRVTALTVTSPGFSAASRAPWPSGWQAARIGKRRYISTPTESALSMSVIARELRLSVSRVSRLIARAEGAKHKD